MSELFYTLSVAAYLIGCAAIAAALWGAVEGVYWIYCKVTKREY
jgi:hypothetical protein